MLRLLIALFAWLRSFVRSRRNLALEIALIVKPETVIGWHRQAFRRYWRFRSRSKKAGKPTTSGAIGCTGFGADGLPISMPFTP